MYCPKCGTRLPDDTLYCFQCGEPLEPVPPVAEPDPMAETAEGTAEPGVGSATEPADEPAAEPAENATGEAGEAAAADAPGEENPRRSYMIEPSAQTDEAATLEPVNDYRVFAIVLLVFCSVSCCCACLSVFSSPFFLGALVCAIVGMVYSTQAGKLADAGQIEMARLKARSTRNILIIAACLLGVGILIGVVVCILSITNPYLFQNNVYQDLLREFEYEFPNYLHDAL